MTDTKLNVREIIFRVATEAASLSFDRGISTAAEMIREAIRSEKFLAALRQDPGPALAQLAALIESPAHPRLTHDSHHVQRHRTPQQIQGNS